MWIKWEKMFSFIIIERIFAINMDLFKKNGINILSVIIYWFQLIVLLINIAKMKSYRDETNQWVVVDFSVKSYYYYQWNKTEEKSVFSLKISEIFTNLRWDFVTALISNICIDSI